MKSFQETGILRDLEKALAGKKRIEQQLKSKLSAYDREVAEGSLMIIDLVITGLNDQLKKMSKSN